MAKEETVVGGYTDAETGIVIQSEDNLRTGFARRTRKMNDTERMWEYLEALCDEESLEKLDALTGPEFQEFIKRFNASREDASGSED